MPILPQFETDKKKGLIKRLPPPIMYKIEPMSEKIDLEVIQDKAKDQALLGDQYDIKVIFHKKDNIKLKSLSAVFLNFT